jgi:hypothetical protein
VLSDAACFVYCKVLSCGRLLHDLDPDDLATACACPRVLHTIGNSPTAARTAVTCCLHLCSPQRLVRHLWRAYCYALATSPLATQSATAVVGFAAGDACAQVRLSAATSHIGHEHIVCAAAEPPVAACARELAGQL